jgi:hypothetical protein
VRRGLFRGKPVFHIEYVTKIPVIAASSSSSSKSNAQAAQVPAAAAATSYQIWHPSAATPNATQEAIRNRLCVRHKTSLGSRLSTVIKTINLDGWLMECDGKVSVTKANPVARKAGSKGPIDRGAQGTTTIVKQQGRSRSWTDLDDPTYAEILAGAVEPHDAEWEAELEKDLAGLPLVDTGKRKGAAKDKRPSPYVAQQKR